MKINTATKTIIDGNRYYVYRDMKFPSVTTVLSETMSVSKKCALANWRKSLGEDSSKIQQEIKDRGTNFHKLLELIIMHKNEEANQILRQSPELKEFLVAGKKLIAQIMSGMPVLSEAQVFSLQYQYAGTIDLMAHYPTPYTKITATGREVLFDWKTSSKIKSIEQCEDFFLQLAAYANALRETYAVDVESASVCIFYRDSDPDVYKMRKDDIKKYFDKFLSRLDEFHLKKTPLHDDVFADLCARL
jgi:hypothetical protein